MRVISQEGKRSYDFNSSSVFVDDGKIYLRNNYANQNNGTVGSYGSEFRAIEVFELMHYAYDNDEKIFIMPKE